MAETKKDILWRVYVIFGFLCFFGLAILIQIARLQLVQGEYWKSKADSLQVKYVSIQPSRGNIYSSDGSLISTSMPVYDLRLDMKADLITKSAFNDKIDSLSQSLAGLFKDKSKDDYKRVLREARKEGDRYFLLQRNISFQDLKKVKSFPLFNTGRYKGGLIVEQKSIREKPFNDLASRTIGYKVNNVVPVGIEGAFDKQLTGSSGKRLMQKLSGNVWKPINDDNEIDPQDGNDVITAIDLNVQDVAEHSLLEQLKKNDAEAGCAVLMEVETGEIKAIANLHKVDEGIYNEDFNYAVGYATEPGSTFKLASLLAGIEDGLIDINETVDTQNGVIVWAPGMTPMRDAHEGGLGVTTVKHVFEMSSNVGISKVIKKYYTKDPQSFIDRLHKLHFGDRLGLQITGEGNSRIKNTTDRDWSKVSLPYLSIGYESRVTPLQVLTFYNAIANNGRMVKPLFVKELQLRGKTVKKFSPQVLADSICSPATIAKAKELLEGVVQNGTATKFKKSEYKVAGKTGTAQMASGSGGYKSGKVRYQASFVGYFPADNPKYSCIVCVYNPSSGGYYGADVALPVFKDIADKVYSVNLQMHKELLPDSAAASGLPLAKNGISKTTRALYDKLGLSYKQTDDGSEWITSSKSKNQIVISGLNQPVNSMPNVMGMGLRDALYLLESKGLTVKVVGRGRVNKQSLATGSKFLKGQQITIELS